MAQVTCAAACKYADLRHELCLKEHIIIGYRGNQLDWPCHQFEPRPITSAEFAQFLLIATAEGINLPSGNCHR
jgi:hypothetical protein